MASDLSDTTKSFCFNEGASSLQKKYFGFKNPFVEILIDNTNLNTLQCVVNKAEIELSAEYPNSAVFEILGVFILDECQYKSSVVRLVMPGKLVKISIGYLDNQSITEMNTNQEVVFYGYIVSVNYAVETKRGYSIQVECADVRCAMMSGRYYMGAIEKTLLLAAKSILTKNVYQNLYASLIMDQPPKAKEEDMEVQLTAESDFDFIQRVARKTNYEFFMVQDKLIFRQNRGKSTAPIITLGPGKGVYSMNLRRNIAGLVRQVEVVAADEQKAETIKAQAKTSAKWSKDSSAVKISEGEKRVVVDSSIKNKEQAQLRANSELDSIEWRYGSFQALCVGLPELVPGRFLAIEKAAKNAFDGTYYITKVKHSLAVGKGLTSSIEAKINQIN